MNKLQIVRIGYPHKGTCVKDQMSELCQAPDGAAAMVLVWDGIFSAKRELFTFHRDVVAARLAADDEVRSYAKLGGFGMASRSMLPMGGLLGMVVSATAGAVGAAAHHGGGMKGVVVNYRNPKGSVGCMIVLGLESAIDTIIRSIPTDKMQT